MDIARWTAIILISTGISTISERYLDAKNGNTFPSNPPDPKSATDGTQYPPGGLSPIALQVGKDKEVRPFSVRYIDQGGLYQQEFWYLNTSNWTYGLFNTGVGSVFQQSLVNGNTTWNVATNFVTNGALDSASAKINFSSRNIGHNSSIGANFLYKSESDNRDRGFDVGRQNIAVFQPSSYPSDYSLFKDEHFDVAVSPDDSGGHRWATLVAEWNIVNRGIDTGFMRDRHGGPSNTGGLLLVPESTSFGFGGEGSNATFAFSLSHSGLPNSKGDVVKFYTGYLAEPNAIAGVTGRAAYWTGDITGEIKKHPYAPLQIDGAWLHGLDTTLASFDDDGAVHLASGQKIYLDTEGKVSISFDKRKQLVIVSNGLKPLMTIDLRGNLSIAGKLDMQGQR